MLHKLMNVAPEHNIEPDQIRSTWFFFSWFGR